MPPSERNAPAGDEPDDIVEKTPSHPVTTTLLIVSSVALLLAIGLTGSELGRYVNKTTRGQLQEFKITAVEYDRQTYEPAAEGGEATPTPSRRRAAGHGKTDGAAAPEAPAEHAPAEKEKPADAPAAPEGGSGN